MSAALQKPWMKDLPKSTVELAKKKAKEATVAWNDTVTGILTASKAIADVHAKIGHHYRGSFGGWAEEELGRSPETATCLAAIGRRYEVFSMLKTNLPPSWTTLYEVAKEEDERVFKAALRRVRPETTRGEMIGILTEQRQRAELAPPAPPPRVKKKRSPQTQPVAPEPVVLPPPKDAAKRLTVAWHNLLEEVQDIVAVTRNDRPALSPEAVQFIRHKYVDPIQTLLQELFA